MFGEGAGRGVWQRSPLRLRLLAAIALMLALFAFGNPLSLFTANLPPIEDLNLERIKVVDGGFEVTVVNGGPVRKPIRHRSVNGRSSGPLGTVPLMVTSCMARTFAASVRAGILPSAGS